MSSQTASGVSQPRVATTLEALRAEIGYRGLAGVIIPRFDGHQGEYCADHDNRLAYVSGFTGSAGLAIVTMDRAAIFVDGRYQVQVRNEIDLDAFTVEHLYDAPPETWLRRIVGAGERIGFNPMLIPLNWHRRFEEAIVAAGGSLVALDTDPVDAIWADQPPKPLGRIDAFPIASAGETSQEKRMRVAGRLVEAGADYLVEAQPDNIAWLLNVRGSDVAHNPFPQSYIIIDSAGRVEWFVHQRKLPNALDGYEFDGVECRDPARLNLRTAQISGGHTVMVDPDFAPVAVALVAQHNNATLLARRSPITEIKAVKNEVELAGFRSCHAEDGAAVVEYLAWLSRAVAARKPLSEHVAETKLLEFRKARRDFVEPSFSTISAFGANAAMCHYSASPGRDAAISANGFYLVDSGGQYRTGTTDITRTLMLGPIDDRARLAYTAVLKGFISMLMLRFPRGTQGHQIDAFARRALWDIGLDYDHGTGHGVGHFLSVHEHPQRLAKTVNPVVLVEGMVMTVEPGFYEAGRFGIRIENQVEIVREADGFLRFDSLTLAPIDLVPVSIGQLTAAEIGFLNGYHARVWAALEPLVNREARDWLFAATRPLRIPAA